MKIDTNKATWTSIAFACALVSGAPAWADDTELLLVTPAATANAFNANILMIIDSSGSMRSDEQVNQPYDGTVTYPGICDASKMFWSANGTTPNCEGENDRFIDKTAFLCKKAQRQIDGIGLYQDLMVQHRADNTGAVRWETLRQGNATDIVECQADSGFDGAGPDRYAQAGTDLAPYTADPTKEVAWGSGPASKFYTIFDGNYLNWIANPTLVTLSRLDIVKAATKIAMSSINNSNIGVMRFNGTEGGMVIQAMTDLDSNRAALDAVVDGIDAGGNTPLAETLYESALYWLGAPAEFGTYAISDADAFVTTAPTPEQYLAPQSPVCTKNFNVLLTDGQPTQDTDAQFLAPTLPNFASKLGRASCTGTNEGDCLDDIAEYLSIPDIDSSQPGDQTVTTHTIGFTINLPILRDTAEASGGEYFLADDVESLTLALLQIFQDASEQSLSFTSPAVAVNAFNRTQNLNDLYMTVFKSRSKAHWPGNLKKYRLLDGEITDVNGAPAVDAATGFFMDTATSFWTAGGPDGKEVELGGAAHNLPNPASRILFTNNGDSNLTAGSNAISTANSGAYALGDFGLTGAATEPTMNDLIDWARGVDIKDEDNDVTTTTREAMGDPLHSQPAAVVYGGSVGNEDVVVFTATNDGYLHAVDATTGVELWSFIPKELLPNLSKLFADPDTNYKDYGIDGDIVSVIVDRDNNGIIDGTDFVHIVFGLRRGGNSYYALDVTDKNAPKLMWNVTSPGSGQSWSTPVVTRVRINDPALNSDEAVVILGAGYDSVHDTPTFPTTPDNAGAGLLMLDLKTGAELWRASNDVSADLTLAAMTRAFPAQIRVVDLNGDRIADRMYAADVGGQLWRFDIFNGQPASNLVTGGVIARLGAEGLGIPTESETRRIYNAVDVAMFSDPIQGRRFISASVGTGYRAHPLDRSATDRFYSFRDKDVFNRLTQAEYDGYDIAVDGDFVEVSGSTKAVITASDRGWQFTLPTDQKVLATARTFNGELFFVSFAPDTVAAADCQVQVGRNFLYRVSVVNGDPIVNNLDSVLDADADNVRVYDLAQGGIAPSPTFLFPSPAPGCVGAACSPPPIMCVGAECSPPGFKNNPVRTLWTQDGIN